MGLLALSCCLQVKFTKLKWPVCFSLIGGAPLGAQDVCWEAAAMTDHCRKSLVSGGRAEKMSLLDTATSSSL